MKTDPSKVVFSLTAAQLAALRDQRKVNPKAHRDPRYPLVSKGLLEHLGGSRFTVTTFGRAVLTALKEVR